MATSIIHEGPMFKQGRFNRARRRRWFVLYNDRRLACYYDKEESKRLKPIDFLPLPCWHTAQLISTVFLMSSRIRNDTCDHGKQLVYDCD